MEIYVESAVNLGSANGFAAWTFDLEHWGACGQGQTASAAIHQLRQMTGQDDVTVVETIVGDEKSFARDRVPATLPG